jgi:hypothetical protein
MCGVTARKNEFSGQKNQKKHFWNWFCSAYRATQHKPAMPRDNTLAGEGGHGRGDKSLSHRRRARAICSGSRPEKNGFWCSKYQNKYFCNGACVAHRAWQHKPVMPKDDSLAGECGHGRGEKSLSHRRNERAIGSGITRKNKIQNSPKAANAAEAVPPVTRHLFQPSDGSWRR